MASEKKSGSNSELRNLPSVDEVLRSIPGREIAVSAGIDHTSAMIREVIDTMRRMVADQGSDRGSKAQFLRLAETQLQQAWRSEQLTGTHGVINATGVVIHTNLGRAPLSENARTAIGDQATGYCTVEYDLERGTRGKRGLRAEKLLAELTGAEDVLIVNNCAAAAFFVLSAFASGGAVVISRGELVEIGGDFRVPDVLSQSGAELCEVGTTNRTKLADYENAINDTTRMILRVHPSNYRIVGFTAMPSVADLADLARRKDVILYEDIGSGALLDLTGLGLGNEPVVSRSIEAGADIVTFSGDKLLGGPQAGIIAGKAELIEQLRKHPLYRALRVDKLAYAGLEATLDSYRREAAMSEIPVLRMLAATKDEIAERVQKFIDHLGELPNLTIHTVDGESAIGGGAAPAVKLETRLIMLKHDRVSAAKLEKMLRNSDPPVIARIINDCVAIDLRTVPERSEVTLIDSINRVFEQNPA